MQKSIPLIANTPTRISAQCRSLLILSTGLANEIDVQVEFTGIEQPESLGSVPRGFKMRTLDTRVENLVLTAPANCTVVILISNQNVDLNFVDSSNVIATIDSSQLPLSVETTRGTPGAPLYVSGLSYSDTPSVSITDRDAVAVTDTGAAIVAANAARKSLRFANIGADAVCIGTTGITWAKRVMVLEPGDMWVEERAANLAWAAITDATKAASITVQEVLV